MFSSDVSARGMDYPDVSYVLQVGCASSREQYVHRIGRTGRAGKIGVAMLLLCDFESFFLRDLKDLPVQAFRAPAGFPAAAAGANANVATAISRVMANQATRERAEQTYQAWLGFYKGLLRKIGWRPAELVAAANELSRLIGLSEPPALLRKTIGKMGLKGTPGLRAK